MRISEKISHTAGAEPYFDMETSGIYGCLLAKKESRGQEFFVWPLKLHKQFHKTCLSRAGKLLPVVMAT